MKAKIFVLKAFAISVVVILLFVLTNYAIDIYGLFHDSKGKDIEIYTDERTSKYLLSFNYIPQNFEGILIGPSLSNNLNTATLNSQKIYNASLMGANISELKYLAYNAIDNGNIKSLIVCLDPYITKDYGKKSALIDPKQYYSALGSTSLLKTYFFKFVRANNIFPEKFKKVYITPYGYYDYSDEFDDGNSKEKILNMVKNKQQESMYVDPRALQELDELLKFARSNEVAIIGYFSPIPYQILEINRVAYEGYQDKIYSLFQNDDIVINLNDEKYREITSDYNTFIDHGHLSEKGQSFVLDHLEKALSKTKPDKK